MQDIEKNSSKIIVCWMAETILLDRVCGPYLGTLVQVVRDSRISVVTSRKGCVACSKARMGSTNISQWGVLRRPELPKSK